MPVALNVRGHVCELNMGSNSCLPKLQPQSGKFKRSLRKFHKSTIASKFNPRTKEFLRSNWQITSEKRRHVKAPYWYVIHPLSSFAMYRELGMCVVWLMAFFYDPFFVAFYRLKDWVGNGAFLAISILIDVMLISHIAICFNLGYVIAKTKQVILNPKKIAFNYLAGYFLFDFLGTVPCSKILVLVCGMTGRENFFEACGIFVFLRFIRVITMMDYMKQVTLRLKLGSTTHEGICLSIVTMYLIHWWTCWVYFFPKLYYLKYDMPPDSSWVVMANLNPADDNNVLLVYGKSVVMTLSHFYAAGVGKYMTRNQAEFILFSAIYICGSIYFAFLLTTMFEIVTSTNASQNKYEEIVYQLKEYMNSKSLPPTLQYRLLLYYQNRFHERYFREEAILSTISEHLREEIFLHSCRSLIQKVKIFQGMSRNAVGTIVACLKLEVFLTQDIIIKFGSRADSIFFISHGTVAVYLANGVEMQHYEDGDHFGEIPLVLKDMKDVWPMTIVAAEISECFRMSKKDLLHCMAINEQFAKKIRSTAQKRMESLDELLIELEEDEHQRDVLHQLRAGKVLDKARKRQALTKK